MEHQELTRIAAELERSTKQQLKMAKLQCILSAGAAVCCGLVLIAAISLVPRFLSLVETTETLAARANTVLADLETVTSDLAEADLEEMVGNVNGLVDQSREGVAVAKEGVELAVDKINAIDIDTLNQAIKDFSDVVEPLAKFFNIFDR